jgi:hypothetical protein
VERERERDGGESTHPSTPALGLLNGISYAGLGKERKMEGGKMPFGRE